jgi:hypothetical protein
MFITSINLSSFLNCHNSDILFQGLYESREYRFGDGLQTFGSIDFGVGHDLCCFIELTPLTRAPDYGLG